jgi:hypothetical protein
LFPLKIFLTFYHLSTGVFSLLLGENVIMYSSDLNNALLHPCALMSSVGFRMYLALKPQRNCNWWHNFKPSFPNTGFDWHNTLCTLVIIRHWFP